jgi:hypothetical protein
MSRGFRRVGSQEQSVGRGATYDAHFADTAFDGALGGFELEDHSAGNNVALDQALDFLAGDGGKNFFAIEDASNISEINQLIGVEKFSAGCGHVVGIDIVELVVRADAEARCDGDKALAPKGANEFGVQSSEVANKTKAARNFIVDHGFGDETLGVRGGDTDGGLAFRGDRSGEFFVEQAGEDHDSHVAGFAVGDAESGDEFTFDSHALKGGGKKTPAAMDDEYFVALLRERSNLARERSHSGVVFEQCTCEFDYDSH